MSAENCTDETIPPFEEVIQLIADSSVVDQFLLSLVGVLTIGSIGIFVEQVIFVWKNFSSFRTRYLTTWLQGVFPFFCASAMIAIIIPRASVTCDQMSNVYLAICQNKLLMLMVKYYGGERKMIIKLVKDRVRLTAPPLGCCLPFLPDIKVTRRNFRFIKYSVEQAQIVRSAVMMLTLIFWDNGGYSPSNLSPTTPALYLTILNTFSQLLGLYGLTLMVRVSRFPLVKYRVGAKYAVLQLLLICCGLQNLVIGIVAGVRAIPCRPPLSYVTSGSALHHWLLIPETFLLGLWSIWIYRRKFVDVKDEVEKGTVEDGDFDNEDSGIKVRYSSRHTSEDANVDETTRLIRPRTDTLASNFSTHSYSAESDEFEGEVSTKR